jgi:uncharacterized tellurite resistance protein B-like protein
MLKRIADFFSNSISIETSHQPADIDHNLKVATCALLIEMASIDNEFDLVEKERITGYFRDNFGLTETEIKRLFDLAKEQLDTRIDLWGFTNLINLNYSTEQKMKVIEIIWEVIYADGKLSAHEDYLVHKLYKMLNLTHSQMIEAKLNVLKRRGEE